MKQAQLRAKIKIFLKKTINIKMISNNTITFSLKNKTQS